MLQESAKLNAATPFFELFRRAAIWTSRIIAVIALIQLSRHLLRGELVGGVLSAVTLALSSKGLLQFGKDGVPSGRRRSAGTALNYVAIAHERAVATCAEAYELARYAAAAVIFLSASLLVDAAQPDACGTKSFSTKIECQSSYAWSAGALLGLAWVRFVTSTTQPRNSSSATRTTVSDVLSAATVRSQLPLRLPLTGAVAAETLRRVSWLKCRQPGAVEVERD